MLTFSNVFKRLIILMICFIPALTNAKVDACDNLPGTWKGTIHLSNKDGTCDWEVIATFLKEQANFIMEGFVYNGHGDHCQDGENFKTTGTCLNGLVSINSAHQFRGTVFGKSMIIQSSVDGTFRTMQLAKQEAS